MSYAREPKPEEIESRERNPREARHVAPESAATASPAAQARDSAGAPPSLEHLGNRALLSLLRSGRLQRKPRISQPGEATELEAERVANDVVSGHKPGRINQPSTAQLQRMPTEEQQLAVELGLAPRPKPTPKDKPASSGPDAEAAELVDIMTGGQTLDEGTRDRMESRFGESFADVRIHTGHRANEAADAVHARAFTVGEDIIFREGEFAPETTEGQRLLAHELAHVVQQRQPGGGAANERATEQDAHDAAHAVASGGTPAVRERAAPGSVQRFGERELPAPIPSIMIGNPPFWSIEVDGAPEIIYVPGETNPDHPPRARAWETADNVLYVEVSPPGGVHSIGRWKDVRLGRPPLSTPQTPPPKPTPPKPKPDTPPPTIELPETVITADEAKAERPQPQAQVLPAPEPANANELIDSYTSGGDLDERGLGKALLDRALAGDTKTADDTLDTVGSTDRDDVSFEMVSQASDEQLDDLAASEQGRKLLLRLFDELTSGYVSEEENKQAQRILMARARNIDPKKFATASQSAPVIPFSGIGFTNFSSASLSVRRLSNGKIAVRSHNISEHWKDAKRLPSAAFAAGLEEEFDPDQVVGVNLLDEEGKTVYVPAMFLLQLSNQEDTSASIMMAEAVATGLTLGAGGGAAAGRITLGRVATGMGLGAGFSAARQGLEMWEGTRKEFSYTEAGKGVLMGGGLVFVPQFGPMLMAGGVLSGGIQISEGHYATGAFDLGTSLLPLGAKKISGSMPGSNFGRALVFRVFMATENLREDTRTPGLPMGTDVVMVVDGTGKPIGVLDAAPNVAGPGNAPLVAPNGTSAQPSANWMTVPFGDASYQPYNIPLIVVINPQSPQAANPLEGVNEIAAAYAQQPPAIRQFGSGSGTQIVGIGEARRYWQQGSKGGRGALWLPWIVQGEDVLTASPMRGTEAEHPHATGGVKVGLPSWSRDASPTIVLAEPQSRIKTPTDNALTQALKDGRITPEQWLAQSRTNIYRSWIEARAQGIPVPTAQELAAAVLWQEAVMRANGVPGF